MKLLILIGVLAMTLAASAQEDVSPPPVIERGDFLEPPPLPEMEDDREEDFEDVAEEEVKAKSIAVHSSEVQK